MKHTTVYILLTLLLSLHSKALAQEGNEANILEGKIRVVRIESVPTRPEEQTPGQEYVYDYRVLHELNLTEEEAAKIKVLVNRGSLFDAQNKKSCLFQGEYAIVGRTKTKWFPLYFKTRGEVIVSTGQCGKAIILKNGEELQRDMASSNALEELLKGLK